MLPNQDSFKSEAEASAREVERNRIERQELLVTIQRLQDEVGRQSRRVDENFLARAEADFDRIGIGAMARGGSQPLQSLQPRAGGVDAEEALKEAIATAIVEENWDVVNNVLPLFRATSGARRY